MNEQFATVGDVELCYETFGNPEDPAMLLIMGLGTQMIAWHEDFCAELVSRGFFVIRYRQPRLRTLARTSTACRRRPSRSCSRADRATPPTRWRTWPTTPSALLDHLGIESRARHRRVDGRDDRPDDRRRAPGPRALAGLDHVEHGQPLAASPGSAPTPFSCVGRRATASSTWRR